MERIDLTLRGEFTDSERPRFDDARIYEDKLGHKDQRRAKKEILNVDTFLFLFSIKIDRKEHVEFFEGRGMKNDPTIQDHENILRITGILTSYLKMEYDAGYGSEDTCDCCGGYRNQHLNSFRYGLCEKCVRFEQLDNKHFWDRRERFSEIWVD